MKNSNITVWQSGQSDKILQDKTYTKNTIDSLVVKLYKNETESVRFYITPNADVKSLGIEIECATFGLNLSVGYALYMQVENSSAGTKSPTGFYPDALLPFPIAEKHGLNRVKAGENQEIYIQATTQKDVQAGEYETKITIFADGEKIVLPLTLTVWDYALPDKNHTRQYFIIDEQHLNLVEGNAEFKKYATYYEQLLKYRVNGSRMPFSLQEDYRVVVANYIKNLRKYYADERITVFNFPVFYLDTYDDIDYKKTEYSFTEIAKASIQDGVDYFEKAVTYLWILDEPHLTPAKIGYCKTVLPKFERLKGETSAKCLRETEKTELCKRVANSIKKMPNVITSAVNANILPENPDEYFITWCPSFDGVSADEFIKMTNVLNRGKKWWYGCNWPAPPYPTYHIDDTYLSPRVLSWIQYAYNVTGNLYWRVNYWARKEDGDLKYVNPYERSTYKTTNGEGMLVYPGKPFGIDGFVPSVRLENIRDGIEDYEALYALERLFENNAQKVNEQSVAVNEFLTPLYTRLFVDTRILSDANAFFEKARETVANTIIAADKYAFTVLKFDKERKIIRFFADCDNVQAVGGTLNKRERFYELNAVNGVVSLIFKKENQAEQKLEIFVDDVFHECKYSLSFNWEQTEKKYCKQSCSAESIVKPYYDILEDEKTLNYKDCCKALGSLIGFVWRTGAVIEKQKMDNGYQLVFTLPEGTFKTEEAFKREKLDEKAGRYTLSTQKKTVTVKVENEKGTYSTELYVY